MGSIPATPSTKHATCFPPSSVPASIEISIKLMIVCLKGPLLPSQRLLSYSVQIAASIPPRQSSLRTNGSTTTRIDCPPKHFRLLNGGACLGAQSTPLAQGARLTSDHAKWSNRLPTASVVSDKFTQQGFDLIFLEVSSMRIRPGFFW